MIEKQTINGKDVWFKVNPYHVDRENRNIIPIGNAVELECSAIVPQVPSL